MDIEKAMADMAAPPDLPPGPSAADRLADLEKRVKTLARTLTELGSEVARQDNKLADLNSRIASLEVWRVDSDVTGPIDQHAMLIQDLLRRVAKLEEG